MDTGSAHQRPAALVAAAGRGVGKGIALARAGFRVAINYHESHDEEAGVVAEIEATGGKAFVERRTPLGRVATHGCRMRVAEGPR